VLFCSVSTEQPKIVCPVKATVEVPARENLVPVMVLGQRFAFVRGGSNHVLFLVLSLLLTSGLLGAHPFEHWFTEQDSLP